jgi:hypothetical protein
MITSLQHKNSFVLVVAAFSILLGTSVALAQTTSFTYQGRLTDGGTAANGNYDLQFVLFDSLSGGAQVGATQTLNTVAVSNGVFTVSLDFGANSFPGANRFLEISARPTGGSFTLLTPRQQITSTPYAVRSLGATSADTANNATQLGGVAAANYVQTSDSRLSDPRPPTPGSSNYIQNSASPQASSNFNISGNGTVAGTLSGNLVNATTQYNLNGSRILSNPGDENLFAGTGAGAVNTGSFNTFVGSRAGAANTATSNTFVGQAAGLRNTTGDLNSFVGKSAGVLNTTGRNNSFFGSAAGQANTGDSNSFFGTFTGNVTTGNENSFFGDRAGISNTAGRSNAFFGFLAGSSNSTGSQNTLLGFRTDVLFQETGLIDNATAIGANARADASNALVLGSIKNINGATADTKVGIGTTAPKQRLHVKGQGLFTADAATFDPGDNVGPAIRIGYDVNGDYGYINANNTGVVKKNLVLQPNGSQGNVGIGTTAPLRLLHVNGRARIGTIPLEASNASLCFLGSTGDLVQCGASSLKWKTNVQPFRSGLDIIQRLRPISFNWKQDGRPDIGLGAEDVAKVAPSLTFLNSKGEAEGVKYERLSMLLINAIKEQQEQIQQQQSQLERQNKQIEGLKKLVCRSRRRAAMCK